NFTFTRLFEPNDSQQDLNPSALAIDDSPSALFGGLLFMGTFGPSLGDDFDGQIYAVSPQGQIAPFITAFVDGEGQPAFRNGLEVTGLFDVTDMAFPPTFDGPFGPYLYVLSENIDQNGSSQAGGFSSDLWRVAADGAAELFVENFADGVISLAFGSFAYGNDLFVATFQGGKVYRITPAGDVDPFYDFSIFSSNLMVSDVVFTPSDLTLEPMADALLLSLVSGNAAFLVQIQPNGADIQIWGSGFATGDVSSGDLLFNPDRQLIVAQQDDKNLVRVDYENLLDTRLDSLALRREVLLPGDPNETIAYAPYLLATVGNRPRILRLGDGQLDSIRTESRPVDLSVPDPPDDTLEPLQFTFDPDGQLIAWMPHRDSLEGSTRADDAFTNFFTGITGDDLAASTPLADPCLVALAIDPAGTLYTLARNADSPELAPEDLAFDDRLLALEPGQSGLIPGTLLEIPALTRASITLAGPGDPNTFDIVAGDILNVTLEDQPAGDYLLQLDSIDRTAGDYELLVGVDADFSATYTLTAADTPRTFTTVAGDRLDFVLTGPGQASLQVDQRPDGTLIALHELDLTGTRPDTEVSFVNRDNPGDLSLDAFSLDGSLQLLDLEADLQAFEAPAGSRGAVKFCRLGRLRSLDAPNHSFQEFHVAALGEPDAQNLSFDAARLTELYVAGDVDGIRFFSPGHRNIYRTVIIDGRVVESVFYGLMLLDFRVRNLADADLAFDASALDFRTDNGRIRRAIFDQGDVVDSFLAANRAIDYVELSDGNLTDTSVSAIHSSSSIGDFLVLSDAAPGPDSPRGNITGVGFSVYRRFDRLHADGNIDENTSLYFRNTFAGKLNELSSAGHCAATLGAGRIMDIRVGYDRNATPLPESDSFTGSDFSGSASVIFLLKEINVTGAIRDASLATTYPGVGYIGNVYAQDGCLDSNLSAERTIRRIMIGYENGNRRQIMNLDADVSGTIATRALGRLYYTGSIDDLTLDINRNVGPVHDDNPAN
ncbi:MAG: hypothetical protein JW741_20855, partial [Sedimentisphaerales bacterium]|nr:hypothetical protein [Sedimentisphaerales bacterium]